MEEKKEKYKCEVCGRESEHPMSCHNEPMKKMCNCGSDKYSENCCEV